MQKVKIKALTNLGTNDYPSCPIQEGETADVSPEVAAKLVAHRHGVVVELPPEATTMEASTPEPEPEKEPEAEATTEPGMSAKPAEEAKQNTKPAKKKAGG